MDKGVASSPEAAIPADEPKKHRKGFWGMVGAVRRSKENSRDRSKSKVSDQADHPPVEERPESDNFSGKTLLGDRPVSKVSDQAVQPPVEERPDSDNFSRSTLLANTHVSEPRQGERWEHNPEGKLAEELAEEYRDLIGRHPLEENSDSEATVTEPETHNNRATAKSDMTTWTGIMRQASETTTESTKMAQSREKSAPKKHSPEQMSEVQRRIRNIEQAQRGPAPVEAIKEGPVLEAEVFKIAKKRLDMLHREGEQTFGKPKPVLPKAPTLNTQSSRSPEESKTTFPKAQTFTVPSSRSSGLSGERKPALSKERIINVQSSGTRRSDKDIEAETSKSRNLPRSKTFSDTNNTKDGLGLILE
jgi:hypothetical protein